MKLENILLMKFYLQNYKVYRCDRGDGYGGVGVTSDISSDLDDIPSNYKSVLFH